MLCENILGQHIQYHSRVEKKNVVGPRVREARRKARPRISQSDLVARLQLLGVMVDQSAISKIEKGRRPVSDIEVVALAKALKVSVSWLLEETGDVGGLRYERDDVSSDTRV